jgi:PBP1b-binding outer membrane lipoprotein LpoB
MKKILLVLAIGTFIASCNEAADKAAETTNAATETVNQVTDSLKAAVTDTAKPVVADTTKAAPAVDTTKKK